MSALKRAARQSARGAVLAGAQQFYRVTGATRRALAAPGITILLIHNTPPHLLANLDEFISRNREQFVGWDAVDALVQGQEPTTPGIAVSFDDGFSSNLEAARMLRRHDLTGCFYVPSDVIGAEQVEVDRFFRRPQSEGVMDWTDLEWLVTEGHTVGSHCKQHLPLMEMDQEAAQEQIWGSVALLRERLGDVRHFAWPFGGLQHAPAPEVVRWCAEVEVTAASGVRGRNLTHQLAHAGYLRRDAVDLNHLRRDLEVFVTRLAHRTA